MILLGGGGVGFLRGCFFNVLLLFCYFCWVFKVIKKNIIKKNKKKNGRYNFCMLIRKPLQFCAVTFIIATLKR